MFPPPDRRPKWEASKKRLLWPNGATATIYSAHDPESLRGPQFDAAWVDELAKWRNAQATWDMLQFSLRLGDDPRQCVTTTPRNVGVLKSLLNLDSTVTTHATTYANAAHLADSFLTEVRARYAGTRLGRQELDGVLMDGVDGALWQEPALVGAQIDGEPVMELFANSQSVLISNADIAEHELDVLNHDITVEVSQVSNVYGAGSPATLII